MLPTGCYNVPGFVAQLAAQCAPPVATPDSIIVPTPDSIIVPELEAGDKASLAEFCANPERSGAMDKVCQQLSGA